VVDRSLNGKFQLQVPTTTFVSIIFQMREYVQSIFLKNPQDVCAHVPCGFGAHQAHGLDGLAMFSIAITAFPVATELWKMQLHRHIRYGISNTICSISKTFLQRRPIPEQLMP
jgi:hypothetical protein